MSFTSFEFPNVDNYDSDLREILSLYKKLKKIYDGLQDEINKIIKYIEEFIPHTNEIIQNSINEQLDIWKNRVSNLERQVSQLEKDLMTNTNDISRLSLRIEEIRNELKFEIMTFENMINTIYENFANYKENIDSVIKEKMNELEKFVLDNVTSVDRLNVNNPINAKFEDINKVLNDMYILLQQNFGITAKEYDELYIKARIFDNWKLTAQEYDTKGFMFIFRMAQLSTRSPWDGGKYLTIEEYLFKLASYHMCALRADEYDSLKLRAEKFDNYNLTAYEYDWCGRCKLTDRGISAEEYDRTEITAEEFDKLGITREWYDNKGAKLMFIHINYNNGGCECNERNCKHGAFNL